MLAAVVVSVEMLGIPSGVGDCDGRLIGEFTLGAVGDSVEIKFGIPSGEAVGNCVGRLFGENVGQLLLEAVGVSVEMLGIPSGEAVGNCD